MSAARVSQLSLAGTAARRCVIGKTARQGMDARRRTLLMMTLAGAVVALACAPPALAQGGQVRAGAVALDASWHVGASAGQYASDPQAQERFDPSAHAIARAGSYGIQSRLQVRALVVQGPDGKRVAVVKNDLYIPQDLLWRRAAQILEDGDSGIGRGNFTMAVTHNHSSPFYSSTSPGVWTFQDVFDVRFYDYYAKRMAAAVEQAADQLKPVRVGASVNYFDKTHRNSFGPAVAETEATAGTPAGYPNNDADHDMTVVRFDDVSDPARPKPLANLVNFSLHPEFLDGNNLISADYLGPLERMVDRETDAVTIYTQNAVGTAEPERSSFHDVSERLEFTHREYGQADYGARLMADAVVDTWRDIERGTPPAEYRDRFVPFSTSFPVAMEDRFYPGPFSHPFPTAQNCTFSGNPLDQKVGGVPTCQSPSSGLREIFELGGFGGEVPQPPTTGIDPGISAQDLRDAGIPVPDNLSAPSYTALEEDVSVHLQAFRLGEILFTVCSCEQWADQSRNIKTRTNAAQGDQYLGYDWSKPDRTAPDPLARHNGCRQNPDGTWTCPNPRADRTKPDEPRTLPPISDEKYRRFRAQVNNAADGWNDAENAPTAESEPADPEQIKGNYTQAGAELPPELGYRLTVPIGMGNDYNGYIATYREYQRGDHYRKALTGWGPHSSDYMASRLVTLGGLLKNPSMPLPRDQEQERILDPKVQADVALNDERAAVLGRTGETAIVAFERLVRDDAGPVEAVKQPADIRRFDAALFTWNGGNNFVDNPEVRVERRVGANWVEYADQSGELPVTLKFPRGEEAPSYLQGSYRWEWTAHFEAFTSDFDTGERPRSTPVGEYRFVARGQRQQGNRPVPYSITSEPFRVGRWDGVTVPSIVANRSGRVRFAVGPTRTLEVKKVKEPKQQPPDLGTGDEGGATPNASAAQAADPAPTGTVTSVIGPIDYPDSYDSPTPFIRASQKEGEFKNGRTVVRDPLRPNDAGRFEWYCFGCAFRPWADTAEVSCAEATVVRARGGVSRVRAHRQGDGFALGARLRRGDVAFIAPGGIRDANGEENAAPSARVTRGEASPLAIMRAGTLSARRARCGARPSQRPNTGRGNGRSRGDRGGRPRGDRGGRDRGRRRPPRFTG